MDNKITVLQIIVYRIFRYVANVAVIHTHSYTVYSFV